MNGKAKTTDEPTTDRNGWICFVDYLVCFLDRKICFGLNKEGMGTLEVLDLVLRHSKTGRFDICVQMMPP